MPFDPDAVSAKLAMLDKPMTNKGSSFDPDAVSAKLAALDKPAEPTSGSQDLPIGTDVYKSDALRTAASFGNDPGVAKAVIKNGYVNVARNKTGDLVFKHADGNWYKDNANFTGHPINWLESHVGAALPMAGMVGGGVGGGSAGSIPGAMAGAGFGAAAGESGRQMIGRNLGTYDADATESLKDVGKEAALGAVGEFGGQAIGAGLKAASPYLKPIVEPIANKAASLGKNLVGSTSEMLTGVPKEAIMRLIERPGQVMGAEAEGNALNIARAAQNEFGAKAAAEDRAIGAARKQAVAQYGEQTVPMAGTADKPRALDRLTSFLDETSPKITASGDSIGSVTEPERQVLSRYEKIMNGNGDSKMKFHELQTLADEIKTKTNLDSQGIAPGAKKTRGQGYLDSLYGQIKGSMHEISPELATADAKYAQYANDANRLGRLENDDTMEGFINNFYGKNKSIMRESAQKLIPESVEDIADIGASRAFTKQGPAGSEMGARRILGSGLATGLGLHGAMNHSPGMMALGGLAHMATSPGVHKAVIGNLSKMADTPIFQAVLKNPELLNAIANPKLRATLQAFVDESGAQIPRAAQNGNTGDRQPTAAPNDDEAKRKFLEGN